MHTTPSPIFQFVRTGLLTAPTSYVLEAASSSVQNFHEAFYTQSQTHSIHLVRVDRTSGMRHDGQSIGHVS